MGSGRKDKKQSIRDRIKQLTTGTERGLEGVNGERNSRSFSPHVREQCWDKADEVPGRDPYRWRRDALGNIVFRKLAGCPGCLCHEYDHIHPQSKGGKGTLQNCQILQGAANLTKGNRTDVSKSDLIRGSVVCHVKDRDMDLLEHMAYGYVRRAPDSGRAPDSDRAPDSGGCRMQ